VLQVDVINVGDIVFVRSHKVKGKVVKIKHFDQSILLEIILSYDRESGIRTTKLQSFALSDVEIYRFYRN
jgi:hypothetical protein